MSALRLTTSINIYVLMLFIPSLQAALGQTLTIVPATDTTNPECMPLKVRCDISASNLEWSISSNGFFTNSTGGINYGQYVTTAHPEDMYIGGSGKVVVTLSGVPDGGVMQTVKTKYLLKGFYGTQPAVIGFSYDRQPISGRCQY